MSREESSQRIRRDAVAATPVVAGLVTFVAASGSLWTKVLNAGVAMAAAALLATVVIARA